VEHEVLGQLCYVDFATVALDKAHRKGVTSPRFSGNSMLTKSGSKLLDFGRGQNCRKMRRRHPPCLSFLLPTLRYHGAQGTILGTLQYMARKMEPRKQMLD